MPVSVDNDVDYVCAHGTSIKANDRTETMAIRQAFTPRRGPRGGQQPQVDGRAADGQSEDPDPECDLYYVLNVARRMPVHVAVANAFGFGGRNCVAMFTAVDA